MRRGTHPLDLVTLALGVYAAACPLWTTTTSRATMTMILLGAITVMLSLAEVLKPDMEAVEGLTAVVGLLMVLSPFAMRFSDVRPVAVTAWVVGAICIVVGVLDVRSTHVHGKGWTSTAH